MVLFRDDTCVPPVNAQIIKLLLCWRDNILFCEHGGAHCSAESSLYSALYALYRLKMFVFRVF